jgi:Xaa-Pro aminopeptidase
MTEPSSERMLARAARLAGVRDRMRDLGVDALLLSLGADLPWLSGYEAMPLERLTMLVVPVDDEATLVVPALEAPRVAHDRRLYSMRPWKETEDPVSIVASLVGGRRRLAVSDRCWAAPLLGLQRELPGASWRRASEVVGPLRAVKDAEEVAALRAAGAAADRVAAALLAGEIKLVGRTERQVSEEIGARLRAEGHAKANFAIVASGPNSASPHHEPGERRIGPGEVVVCDFGGTLHLDGDVGYCSDTTRTVVTGEPAAAFVELYQVLEEAQAAAVAAASVGTRCEEVDRTGRALIDKAGFGEAFLHRIGHGIGIEEHEDPYLVAGNPAELVAGNAFSVEPGIYLAGRYGARIEDIVVATEDGPLLCNDTDHALHVVEA